MADEHHQWEPLSPQAASELLTGLSMPWWVAGGVAIDLFVGRPTRPHHDLDVQILRRHQLILQAHLRDWDLYKTNQPGLGPWLSGEVLKPGVNQVWCRPTPESAWCMEIMLMDTIGDRWVYRRTPSIGGPVASLGCLTPDGIPYLSPEIQLLYKARPDPLPKDEQDFEAALPRLGPERKLWLRSALIVQYPGGHPWVQRLD